MKPVVFYKGAITEPRVDGVVILERVENHPAGLRGELVRTSRVVRVGENGEFETENTIYRRKV